MPTEVIPTNHPHDDDRVYDGLYPPGRTREQEARLDELIRKQGTRHVRDVRELACPGLFDDDEEHEEFLRWIREERNKDLA